MTSATPAVIRLRESFEGEGKPKGYKKTRAFLDEASGGTIYACDIVGHVARSRVRFCDEAGEPAFSIKPSRVIMPMDWRLTAEGAASGAPLGTLNQKVFSRGFWAGLDPSGRELFRAVDPQKLKHKIAMQALGGAVSRYVLMTGSDPLLRLEPAAAEIDMRLLCSFMLLLYEITVPLDRLT